MSKIIDLIQFFLVSCRDTSLELLLPYLIMVVVNVLEIEIEGS